MLIADHYPPPYLGGGETHIESLANSLQKRGHHVTVFALVGTSPSFFEKKDGVDIFRFDGFFQRLSFLFRNPSVKLHPPIRDPLVVNRLKSIIERARPEIIHVHSSGGWIIYSVLPLRKKMGIPIVVTLHNFGLLCPILTLTRGDNFCQDVLTSKCISCGTRVYGRKSFLVYLLLRLSKSKLKQIDKFIAISPHQSKVFVEQAGLDKRKSVVIPNSVDTAQFSSVKHLNEKTKMELEKLGVDQSAVKIVHVSSLNSNKVSSIEAIVNSAPIIVERFPHVQILIVGDGPLLKHVTELAEKANQQLGKRVVVMTGFVKNDEMPAMMSISDIVVGVGRVAVEAMACGKPVIIAGTSVGPFGGNYGGIVTQYNVNELSDHNFSGRNSREKVTPEKIAKDCIRLLEDGNYRLAVGISGREYVERNRDTNEVVQRVEEVYRDTIEENERNRECSGFKDN
jgi:glycosyltransferase involved in cell wall biosynthesis